MENLTKVFVQPRHSYASENGEGHIHLSAPMITAMARLDAAGVSDISLKDDNFEGGGKGLIDADVVGINLVGAPYIPRALEIIRDRVREGVTVLLGGQIIDSLDNDTDDGELSDDLKKIFAEVIDKVNLLNGNRDSNLKRVFGLEALPTQEEVSSISIWENIDDEQMRAYLSHEMSMYLSQGCKHKCTYCQARKNTPELYRDLDKAAQDLEWLSNKALSLNIAKLDIYFSNLDIFQNPDKLKKFLKEVIRLKEKHGFTYNLRGLATAESLLEADEETMRLAREAGVHSIGLGIDGATYAAWKSTGKLHNISNENDAAAQRCIDAIKKTFENGFSPEILMVFGHRLKTFELSKKDLEEALEFTKDMVKQFGAIPRPHVVKNLVPGAEEWKKKKTNAKEIEMLLSHPEYFQALDYTALPSEITYPDSEFRALVEKYYREVCALSSEKSTKIVYPNTPEFQKRAAAMGTTVEKLNEGQFDR
jgi:hypothetical protein